jgi:hypothetical protein
MTAATLRVQALTLAVQELDKQERAMNWGRSALASWRRRSSECSSATLIPSPTGLPVEALAVEPSLERGEPIAAAGDRLLLAEPRGRAMRVYTTRCEASGPPPAPPTPSASAGPDDD